MVVAQSLTVELYPGGIAIFSSKKAQKVFIGFNADDNVPTTFGPTSQGETFSTKKVKLNIVNGYHTLEEPKLTVSLPALIGYIGLDMGYLLFVSKFTPVLNIPGTSINTVKDTLLIPLVFQESFQLLTSYQKRANLSKNSEADEEGESDECGDDTETETHDDQDKDSSQTVPMEINDLDDIESVLTQDAQSHLNSAESESRKVTSNDIFFTNSGILADSYKSQPFVSLNNENVNTRVYDKRVNDDSFDSDIPPFGSIFSKGEPMPVSLPFVTRSLEHSRSVLSLHSSDVNRTKPANSFPVTIWPNSNETKIKTPLKSKLKRNIKYLFRKGGFYFSWNTDLFHRLRFSGDDNDGTAFELYSSLKEQKSNFFWNRHLLTPIISQLSDNQDFPLITTPLVEGFIGCMNVNVKSKNELTETRCSTLLLVSLRSIKRCGLRYMRRGIDFDGDVANFVQTTQYLLTGNDCDSYDIIRGSIPVFFTQNPSKLKPKPMILKSEEENRLKFDIHFQKLKRDYGDITCISLVEKGPKENVVGNLFQKLASESKLPFVWFDFHSMCSKMKYSNVSMLLNETLENASTGIALREQASTYGYFSSKDSKNRQTGVLRINCIDCLDRTNIVSKFFCERSLRQQLDCNELIIEDESLFTRQYSHMWANNGDAISTQYASTNALKGDFTRTQKRKYSGVVNDGILTLSRYYYGYFMDFYRQILIDYLLGNSKEDLFEQFESSLTNIDPNFLQEKKMEDRLILNNIVNVVLENCDGSGSEKIIDSWWVLSTFELNKAKGMPMKDVVFMLTDKAVYFAYLTAEENKLDVYSLSIENIGILNYGHYFSEAFTKASRSLERNIGLRFFSTKFIKKRITLKQAATSEDSMEMTYVTSAIKSGKTFFVGDTVTDNTDSDSTEEHFIALKFPQSMHYVSLKKNIRLVSKICYCSQLMKEDIVSLEEAKKDVSIWKTLEYEVKRYIWA